MVPAATHRHHHTRVAMDAGVVDVHMRASGRPGVFGTPVPALLACAFAQSLIHRRVHLREDAPTPPSTHGRECVKRRTGHAVDPQEVSCDCARSSDTSCEARRARAAGWHRGPITLHPVAVKLRHTMRHRCHRGGLSCSQSAPRIVAGMLR